MQVAGVEHRGQPDIVTALGQQLVGPGRHDLLGRAGVHHHAALAQIGGDDLQGLADLVEGQGEQDQVGALHAVGQVEIDAIEGAQLFRLAGDFDLFVVPDPPQQVFSVFQRQADRSADLAQADDGDLNGHV